MYCNHCKVEILDDTAVCPFCKTILRQIEQAGENTYPDILEKAKKRTKILLMVLFFAGLAESILVFINVMTYQKHKTVWSVLLGGIILFAFLMFWSAFEERAGHIKKIYRQFGLSFLFLIFMDVMTGYAGWAFSYGVPFLVDAFLALLVVCMCVNHKNWQNYLLLLLFLTLLSGVWFVLLLFGVFDQIVLISLTFLAAVFFFIGLLLFGGKKATAELKRKFFF